MGVFDKFMNAIRINNDDDYDDDDEFYDDDEIEEEEDDEEEEEEKPKKGFFKRIMKSRAKDDYDDDEYDDEEEEEEDDVPAPKKSIFGRKKERVVEEEEDERPVRTRAAAAPASSKVTPMRKRSTGKTMEVHVIKPVNMEEAREIADTLLIGCTVVLNLEGLDVEIAQRVIDFSSGACYSINGSLQKVSSYIFILTPHNVGITGDITDILNSSIPTMRNNL